MDLLNLVDVLSKFLIEHKDAAYIILFLGSMLDTAIGFSFFVYGEIFFLAGAILAGANLLNFWLVICCLYLGGIVGDNISYFLGKKYGVRIYFMLRNKKHLKKFINSHNYNKGINYFRKYGALSVFLGRLLGPMAWIIPFVVGIYRLNYRKFFVYDLIGIIIGIGQFIIVGYFFGKHFNLIIQIIYYGKKIFIKQIKIFIK